MNRWVLSICVSVVVICVQVIVTQYSIICSLNQRLELCKESYVIERSQIDDLQVQLSNLRNESSFSKIRGFVSGVVDAVDRKDYYAEIWHSGYNRGSEVQKYTDEIEMANKNNKSSTFTGKEK